MATHLLPTAYPMNITKTNVGGWDASALKASMNSGEIFNKFTSDFRSQILEVNKVYGTGDSKLDVATGKYKFWLLSNTEIGGAGNTITEGKQYAWCIDQGIKATASTNAGLGERYTRAGNIPGGVTECATSNMWWERSPLTSDSTSFKVVSRTFAWASGAAIEAYGVTLAFCF